MQQLLYCSVWLCRYAIRSPKLRTPTLFKLLKYVVLKADTPLEAARRTVTGASSALRRDGTGCPAAQRRELIASRPDALLHAASDMPHAVVVIVSLLKLQAGGSTAAGVVWVKYTPVCVQGFCARPAALRVAAHTLCGMCRHTVG
jgi:hypothetical protein